MKNKILKVVLPTLIVGCIASGNTLAQNLNFENIRWTWDRTIPLDEVEEFGNGSINVTNESVIKARNNQGAFIFELGDVKSGSQRHRQEYKMEREGGYHSFVGYFNIDRNTDIKKGGVSIAQTHDDGNGSSGVFSIYQIFEDGGDLYFGLQTDNRDKTRDWDKVKIETGQNYFLDINTFSDGNDSHERARLWKGTRGRGNPLETWIINDGSGDVGSGSDRDDQYKKLGAYLLGSSEVEEFKVTWNRVRIYNGVER